MKEMLKSLVRPVQVQLLKRGMCVACAMPLSKAEHLDRGNGTEKVTCKCKRVYVFSPADGTYRRANLEEA